MKCCARKRAGGIARPIPKAAAASSSLPRPFRQRAAQTRPGDPRLLFFVCSACSYSFPVPHPTSAATISSAQATHAYILYSTIAMALLGVKSEKELDLLLIRLMRLRVPKAGDYCIFLF